jgi:hypothetical protein
MLLFRRAGRIDGNDGLLSSIARKATVVLAVWALLAAMTRNSDDRRFIASAQTPCFESQGLARARLDETPCGKLDGNTLGVCMENYDGEGAEVASLYLDSTVCLDGVCAVIISSAAWKAAYSIQTFGFGVELTSGPYAGTFVGTAISQSSLTSPSCSVRVNDQYCGACAMVQCPGNDASMVYLQADCINLGQGTLNYCDQENFGNPGDILKYIMLPGMCGGLGAELGGPVTDPSVASSSSDFVQDATVKSPSSAGYLSSARAHLTWVLAYGVLVASSVTSL